jgi:transposase-like protein
MVHRTKRQFTSEFKANAVELTRVSGKTATEIAKDLGISKTALCRWVRKADSQVGLPKSESDEVKRLRREVETLRMERDFLKKAAAFFAKENQ